MKKKLLDLTPNKIRLKHYSMKTEANYIGWIKQFIFFHNKRHPIKMGTGVSAFIARHVSQRDEQKECKKPSRLLRFFGRYFSDNAVQQWYI